MGGADADAYLRALARHQWIRQHGTPRVTTLVGAVDAAAALWGEWARLAGRGNRADALVEAAGAAEAWLTEAATTALTRASADPGEPLAIIVHRRLYERWQAGRHDRLAAFLAEGLIELDPGGASLMPPSPSPPPAPSPLAPLPPGRARSVAELVLHDALEATPATAGRFRLNEPVSFHFGGRAAEVDLLSRDDELAIEVDGYHHFTDLDRYRRDRAKDRLLQAHGYIVVRFLAEDILADAPAAVRAVVELLGIRRGCLSRRR